MNTAILIKIIIDEYFKMLNVKMGLRYVMYKDI